MKKGGRTSLEEMMLKESNLAAEPQRADAPYDLDDEAAIEWRRIVNCMPANHFIPANYHMLTLLCQHIVESRRQGRLIRNYCNIKDREAVKVYLEIVKQKTVTDTMIHKLSRSMRITQQSTFNPIAVKLKRVAEQQTPPDDEDEYSWK
jgi:phage terminase small subunit